MISLRDHRAILRNGSGHTWDLGPALSNQKTSALQTGRGRGKRTISPARRTLFISFSVYLPVLSFCIFYPGIFLSHTKSYSPSLDLSFCLRLSTRSDRACVQRDNRITQARLCRRSRWTTRSRSSIWRRSSYELLLSSQLLSTQQEQ